jgi:exodeoxyribonuclease VII large subunit
MMYSHSTPQTLSSLCLLISEVLEDSLAPSYWVRAEIAALSVKGHCYMELVEKSGNQSIAAKMRATCWQQTYNLLAPYFESETGQRLSIGMQVLLEVEISFHTTYGMSLNIIGIDPSYTLGDLARQRQQTIQRLREEGVMEMQRLLPLPSLVRRIAVISSADAAGYGDFQHQLLNNRGAYHFHTQLFPALMQGEQSPQSIIQALHTIAEENEAYDVVVIVRGGGATTDLRNFDDYDLACHCAQFPLPIIAGIGHTRDISIVDMVVHTSVKTPTAVAEWLIQHMDTQAERIEQLSTRLQQAVKQSVQHHQNHLHNLLQAIRFATQQRLYKQRSKLDLWKKTIELHSPERIYRMGYTLTTVDGKIVTSMHDVIAGQTLQTHTADGVILSEVLPKK